MYKLIKKAAAAVVIFFVIIPSLVYADVLELKNGKVLNGVYQGGTQTNLRFETNGQIQVIPAKDILALTFTGVNASTTAASGTSASAGGSTHTQASSNANTAVVAAGTTILVRTSEEVGTKNKGAGQRFSARLESKLMAGSIEVAPAGGVVYGVVVVSTKGGMAARKGKLELELKELMIDGQLYQIKTSRLIGEGKSGGLGRKIIKGAAIGGLADGSKGARTGAKVGAGIGIIGGGKHIVVPNGTLLEFTLSAPFKK